MEFVRTARLHSVVLVSICVLLGSCSALTQRLRKLDVGGCGDIKWGMTLGQVQTLLGPKARMEIDPKSATRLEYVKMTIGGIEREGFLATETGTDRVSGVIFIISDLSFKDTFNLLKRDLVETYGVPSNEHMMTAGPLCFWQFPSGSITLGKFKGAVSLAYMKSGVEPVLQ
jgi:hypothetical protein